MSTNTTTLEMAFTEVDFDAELPCDGGGDLHELSKSDEPAKYDVRAQCLTCGYVGSAFLCTPCLHYLRDKGHLLKHNGCPRKYQVRGVVLIGYRRL